MTCHVSLSRTHLDPTSPVHACGWPAAFPHSTTAAAAVSTLDAPLCELPPPPLHSPNVSVDTGQDTGYKGPAALR
jgi:hypothetical protein